MWSTVFQYEKSKYACAHLTDCMRGKSSSYNSSLNLMAWQKKANWRCYTNNKLSNFGGNIKAFYAYTWQDSILECSRVLYTVHSKIILNHTSIYSLQLPKFLLFFLRLYLCVSVCARGCFYRINSSRGAFKTSPGIPTPMKILQALF